MRDFKTISDDKSPSLPWDTFPETADTFATYTLGNVLGKGSFGTVFRVQPDPNVEWYEAVKILHRSSKIDKKRFLEEINRLKEIRLPGIARIHTTGEHNGKLYYAMDYIEGHNIDTYTVDNNGDTAHVYSLILELCDILQALHEQEFIHLDIKPQNVMITVNGEIRLLDFGISSKASEHQESSGLGAGTYEFSSPEQINGETPCPWARE